MGGTGGTVAGKGRTRSGSREIRLTGGKDLHRGIVEILF